MALGSAMRPGGALVVPQSDSAKAEDQAVRVVPGSAGVAVGFPVPIAAGRRQALGLDWPVQPQMQGSIMAAISEPVRQLRSAKSLAPLEAEVAVQLVCRG
jgi:hypothetical protein